MAKVIEQIIEMASPLAENLGLELVDVEFIKEGGRMVLRVYIDSEGGVTHSHCEAMSHALDEELDRQDPIELSYVLEVSSPGIERPLKKKADYIRFRGQAVSVKLFSPINGRKDFRGTLRGLEGEDIILENDKQEMFRLPLSQVAKAHLAFI
jgi:ribosome maturation factor RimP